MLPHLRSSACLRSSTRFGAVLAFTLISFPVLADDVKFDSLNVGPAGKGLELKGVEILGSSLTQDEWTKLLGEGTSAPDRLALVTKLKAASASIAEIRPKDPEAGTLVLRGFKAEAISDGKIGRLSKGGFEGKPVVEGVAASLKGGAMTADDVDLSTLLKAAETGSSDGIAPKVARFTWNGFEVAFPDKDTPADAPGGNMVKVALGAMDGQSSYQGNVPLASTGALRNLVIEMPKASAAGKQLAAIGYDKLDISLTYRGAFDPAKKAFQLDDFTVSGVNIGSLGLRAELGNVTPESFTGSKDQKLAALMGLDVAATELRVVNGGGFEKALDLLAKQQGTTAAALKSQWAEMATAMIPAVLGGDPAATQVGKAVSTFITNAKSLTITVKGKSGPVKVASLAGTSDPMALLQVLSISAAAEGAGAAPAAPAGAPQVAQVAPQAAQAGKLTGLQAWNAIVGNSISGKTEDGDPMTEYYLKNGTVKQLVDDDINTGKWSVKGQNVCILYDDDEDDDETCYKVELNGDAVTYTDTDGKGKRYTLLKGNPKKL